MSARGVVLVSLLWMALGGSALASPTPTERTIVYYNARMALRDGDATLAVKLWLLRNAMEAPTGQVSAHDADFGSVTWAALGDLGICPDGQPKDDDGAGLWPLALHNWVVKNMGRRQLPKAARPFDAFQLGRQRRFVAIGDVLSSEELSTLRLRRGRCLAPRLALFESGQSLTADLSDRQVVARLLRYLLERSRDSLVNERVHGWAAIEARLFDLDLQLTALAARQARRDARERSRRGRQVGLSDESLASMAAQAPLSTLSPDSQAARILRDCVQWPVSEWMTLSPDRRRFLFDQARAFGGDAEQLDVLALGIIDSLIDQGEGAQVQRWIGMRADGRGQAARAAIWEGRRGQGLLALDDLAGFDERGVIALHRGVGQLERGELPQALRSLALALQLAPQSQASDQIERLSRRWLSYVAAQFEITDDLLVTLQELLPRQDYAIVLEDLMWRATFRADLASFERGVDRQAGRGALSRRMALLRPLAAGDVGRFSTVIDRGLRDSPSETLRFLDQLVQRLELEDADLRTAQLAMLGRVRGLLLPMLSDGSAGSSRRRRVKALVLRSGAIVEGLSGLDPSASARERALSLAPAGEVYAGSVRLAPVDPLPWPFRASVPAAPSVFTALELTPLEWRLAPDKLVFGWSIGG